MSNLERHPGEALLEEPDGTAAADRAAEAVEVLDPRDVPLGGPRAMRVRRTLPQRSRSLIGAWCFLDHYGPDEVATNGGMRVPPHPHIGLATVSWLFAGEIEHRDSTGAHAMVRPGELNLMTAGRGVQHSEVSTPTTRTLHGAQLWLALPDRDRHREPAFERFVPEPFASGDAVLRVFLGTLAGVSSPVRTSTALLGAQLDLPAGGAVELELDPRFEHGVLVDAGDLGLDGRPVRAAELAFLPAGRDRLVLRAGDAPARALLIGGEPLGERIVMWWNFVGRDHDEIVQARMRWQSDGIARRDADGWFGLVEGYDGDPLPAPELPGVRLSPRG